jgi:hypothetical protein
LLAKGLVVAATLAVAAAPPRAKGNGAASAGSGAPTASNAFERACIDLVNGKTPKDPREADALRGACEELMKARSEDARRAEQARKAREQAQAALRAQARAQPGQSAAPVQAGESAMAALGTAGNELLGARPRGAMGFNRSGEPFRNTITTNPVGWFTGIGVNAELMRSFLPAFSWTGGAHYSQSASTARTLYTLGFLGGVDWFMIGQNNAGLRIGPRLDVSFGRESSTSSSTSARLGLAGELGYNFIASNGITGEAAFGLGGRVAGDKNEQLSSGAGGEFGPYVKLGLGFSF